MPTKPGRPRLASRELLQEAAFELFQLRGYRATSVEQIAKTAGFSRATFFNFFSSKAELFWLETDALLAKLRASLEQRIKTKTTVTLNEAILEFAGSLRSSDIPWALQNVHLLDASDDLIASSAGRVLELNRVLSRYARARGEAASLDALAIEAQAAAATARLLVGLESWIESGVGRASLHDHLARTL